MNAIMENYKLQCHFEKVKHEGMMCVPNGVVCLLVWVVGHV